MEERKLGNFKVLEEYPLIEPWAYALIVEDEVTGERKYIVKEAQLNEEESQVYKILLKILEWEIKPYDFSRAATTHEAVREYFVDQLKRIVSVYSERLGARKKGSIDWQKVLYHLLKDTVGYGPLEALMKDPFVEDISCDGVGKPLYVWHQRYEGLPTSIVFQSEEEVDSLVLKLAHIAGKHVSVAFPIVDAMLPGGHRLAATFKREVSVRGSSFTIRKFKEKPLSIVDLIIQRSISAEMAAYLWLLMENKMPGIVMGVTGSGKTTALNAIATLLKPNVKVVTIEDTPELRLTLENWVQLVSRHSYALTGSKTGEVSLYDLVRVSLRYRPDVIIVGEVRGEEAYVLFQAVATGHGGLTTIHAENVNALVKRLTSPPMNVPPSYVPMMRWGLLVRRVNLGGSTGRRMTNLWEIGEEEHILVGEWDPARDAHEVRLERSRVLEEIAYLTGKSKEELIEEVGRRSEILKALAVKEIRDYKRVAEVIYRYYNDPKRVLSEVRVA
ncbi:MAG: type II/IV secretion system ATPase subunit [Acidilobaceae archaeon]|nr:type II/IV secretion system ATPase subunit [Acidilobaceae archaeon]MCX8165373.1 type II/IV secretion system ATPase subunit [Acidilobaceae archaeon]MDW7973800.1 type II/IV secretion system ATPase subunit [Sulfolobales archaeon]